ncbi:MAG: hypothetical protein ACREON_12630 [Gemmatimonadaceae bacterium]
MPELRDVYVGEPDWMLRVKAGSPPLVDGDLLGREEMGDGCAVALTRTAAGFRLEYNDTGCYDVSACGRELTWYEKHGADMDLVRVDVLGRVLGVALHARGTLALHGSAVALGDGGVAFLAPKFSGKSTLAMALVGAGAGARLITDDTLAIDTGERVVARPGVHCVRLWNDSAQRLIGAAAPAKRVACGKALVEDFGAEQVMRGAVPLSALYLLAPVRHIETGAPLRRTRLAPVQAAMSIVRHARLAALLGGAEAPKVLRRAAAVAQRVPVFVLEVQRDFALLPEVVSGIVGWHGVTVGAELAAPVSR